MFPGSTCLVICILYDNIVNKALNDDLKLYRKSDIYAFYVFNLTLSILTTFIHFAGW